MLHLASERRLTQCWHSFQDLELTPGMGSLDNVIAARRQMEAASQVLTFDVRGTFEPAHQRSLQAVTEGVSSRPRRPLKQNADKTLSPLQHASSSVHRPVPTLRALWMCRRCSVVCEKSPEPLRCYGSRRQASQRRHAGPCPNKAHARLLTAANFWQRAAAVLRCTAPALPGREDQAVSLQVSWRLWLDARRATG